MINNKQNIILHKENTITKKKKKNTQGLEREKKDQSELCLSIALAARICFKSVIFLVESLVVF